MLEFQNLTTAAPTYRRPDMDVHEKNGELILRAEIPGLTLGEIDLAFDEGELVLDADGWDDAKAGREHYEHVHGRLPLPFGTDLARVTSHVAGDVLELHIPLPQIPDVTSVTGASAPSPGHCGAGLPRSGAPAAP